MKKLPLFAVLWTMITLLWLGASAVGQRAAEKPHPCCYCRCGIKDYHKDCHKLCKLPPSSKGKVRVFNKIEDGFCVEVCMSKKEGKEHLKHNDKK